MKTRVSLCHFWTRTSMKTRPSFEVETRPSLDVGTRHSSIVETRLLLETRSCIGCFWMHISLESERRVGRVSHSDRARDSHRKSKPLNGYKYLPNAMVFLLSLLSSSTSSHLKNFQSFWAFRKTQSFKLFSKSFLRFFTVQWSPNQSRLLRLPVPPLLRP